MRLTKTFLRLAILVICLIFSMYQGFAQVTYSTKNTSTASGSVGTVQVTDVSNNGATVDRLAGDLTPVDFPMIGLSLTAATPTLKTNGSYDIVYTFLVQNYGAINLNTVQVADNLNTVFPSPLTFSKLSLTSSGTVAVNPNYNGTSDTNLLSAGTSTLAVGASATIELTVNVVPNATYGTYNNSATATGLTTNVDAVTVSDVSTNNASPIHGDATKTPLNFTDPTPIIISPSDIEIVKTASTLSPNAGDNITFTIKATNLGGGAAAPVVVNDVLNTTGYALVSATPSKGTFDSNTGVWSVGTLNVGASNAATLTIIAVVLADKPVASAVNTASSNHPGDPVASNNSSTISPVPNQAADLRISNTDNKTSYTPGVDNTYTVIATNPGASIANGSRITYTLPAGISAVWTAVYAGGATGNSGGVNNINESVNMPPGSTVTYTVTSTIPSSQAGVFTTTATIIPPSTIVDVTPANNTAVDDDVKQGDADLYITNTDSKSAYIPGVGNTYTVIATNSGPSDAPGTTVSYLLPTGITGSWTAVYVGGSTGEASGTNNINEVVDMPTGSAIIYTVNTTIPSSFTGPLTATATITPTSTVIDPTLANNTATDIDIQNSTSELSINNTDGKAVYVPGLTNSYTVVVSNSGPSDAVGATLTFPLPSDVTGGWSASFSGGATGNGSGTNNISETVNLPAGSSITYILIADIASDKTDATLTTVATVNAPVGVTDPTPANNTASDTDTRVGGADLSTTLTDGKTIYTPGTTNTYTIVATNNGPSDVTAANVSLPLPAGAVAAWTATFTGGAGGTASGSNSINETVNMPSGSTITYVISGAIPSTQTGELTLIATIAMPAGSPDPVQANNTATDTDTQNSQANLTITNTDNKVSYIPGTTNIYTVVATNTGSSNAPGSTVTYSLPTGITSTWTAVYKGGASGAASGTNAINEIVNMPANGTVTYTITVPIPSSQTGIVTTIASIAAPAGITDLTPTNNTRNDADLRNGDADLGIVNTDNKAIYTPGTNNTYTIVASNTGPSDVISARVTYPLPVGVTATWTAVYNGGATGNTGGTGNINELVNIPIGGTITYTLVAAIPSGQTGAVTTVATIETPIGVNDPLIDNNTATDTDVRIGDSDLSITNTDEVLTYRPGVNSTYTIVANNAGPSSVTGATITYPLPLGIIANWTATYAGGATGTVNGVNSINETVNMPIGSTVTYTVVATIPSSFTGPLTTTATINTPVGTTDSNQSNNVAVDTDTQNSTSNLAITNTDNKLIFTPGIPNTYTVVATNTGPSDAPGTTVSYTSTAVGISGAWTAVYASGATGNASGTGAINELVNIPAGGSVTYTAVVTIPSGQTIPTLTTNATIMAAAGITDPSLADNVASDTDVRIGDADLSITNTDNQTAYIPGINNTYTVVATNNGPSDVTGANISYQLPAGVTATWTAVYTGGATGNGNGSNGTNQEVNMPAGSTITYTLNVTVPSSQTGDFNTLATISLPSGSGDPTPANNTATDTDTQSSNADLSITNTDNKITYTPGTTNTYTVVATNNGPSDAIGSVFTYTLPRGINGRWTAFYTGGAIGSSSGSWLALGGSGSAVTVINEMIDIIPAGGSVIYTILVTIPSDQTAPTFTTNATITAGAEVTDLSLADNTASDTDQRIVDADLSITNTDGKVDYIPGTTNTYTVVATNNGPSDALASTITYTLPSDISATWNATYSGRATGNASGNGAINETVNLPSGSSVTYTVVAAIPSGQLGTFSTTATIAAATGITDSNPTNNTATDTDTQSSNADLSITNTDNKITYTPGTTNTYTVVATNNGPSDAIGSVFTYTLPRGINGRWTAFYTGGAIGSSSGSWLALGGSGSAVTVINEMIDIIPAGGSVIYTILVTIPSDQTAPTFTTNATITAGAEVTDLSLADNTASDTDQRIVDADLSITNTDGKVDYIPGTTNTYTVVATNNGPSDALASTITYTLPSDISATWNATYSGRATGNASGNGAINETVNLPSGSSVTYTVVAAIPSGQLGTFSTTATIAAATGITDSNPTNNTATDTDTQSSNADLSITNTDNKITYTPGTTNTYTVVATNNGPSDAIGSVFTYTLPRGINGRWTAFYTGGAIGSSSGSWLALGGSGSAVTVINEMIDIIPAGGSVIYTILVTIPSDQTAPTFTTNATITAGAEVTDLSLADNTASDTDQRIVDADLSITNTNNQTTYIPGINNTYTVVATNNGSSDALASTITYTLPSDISGTWNAIYSGRATGNASGNGAINETVNLPSGSSVTYTVVAAIPSGQLGTFSATATIAAATGITDSNPTNNTATDTDTQSSNADLSITNTDNKITYTPGTTNTYTVVATNNGPSDAIGSVFTYTLPRGINGRWTAFYTGGAIGSSSGSWLALGGSGSAVTVINEMIDIIPAGGSVIYTILVTIPSDQTAPTFTTNATITAGAEVTDLSLADNTASDTDQLIVDADLSITNTDGKLDYIPGTTNTYTVVASNSGPSDVTGANVTYTVPTGIPLSWTAVYAGGSSGATGGTGNINVNVNMPAGSTVTYTVVATIASNRTGSLTTTATIAPPISLTDPVTTNNIAIDVDNQASQADLSITNTDNTIPYVRGTPNVYEVVVSNNGPSDVTGATVTYVLPAGVIGTWDAVYSGGATGAASGTDNINELVNLPLNGKVTYTVVAIIPSDQLGSVSTVATITPPVTVTDLVPANNIAIDTDTQNSLVDLKIVKSASTLSQYINSQLTFILTVTNNGPSAATGVTTTDLLPTGFTYVSSTPSTGTYNTTTGVWVIGNLASTASATLSTVATVNATGNYTNSASVTGAQSDGDLTNNTSQVTVTPRQLPTAVNDAAVTTPNTPVAITILANDIKGFADLNPASIVILQQPANGAVSINNTTGVATYTPATNYFGNDVFTYTVKDINGQVSNVATVTITINDFPIIGLAKFAKSVVKQVNGSYDIAYLFTVGNYGVTGLNDVSITDDLSLTFKQQQVKVKSITSLGSLKVNTAYDGVGVREMLLPGNTLAVKQIEQLQVVVTVLVSNGETTFLNSAYAQGTSTTELKTEDKSTDGLKPDPGAAGNVTPSDPTPVVIDKPKLHIPGGFSPNGDGTHDGFEIEGAGSSRVNFEIYNRWGNLVYRDTDYKNDWTGKCNQGIHIGENLPEGTYFYIIVLDGTDKYNGSLTLNR